jgi:uncharacterized RDD family membrane protein YckC
MVSITADSGFPAADPDRRFYAFVFDRLLAWSVIGLAVWAAYALQISRGGVGAGTLLVVGAVLLVVAVYVVLLGRTGTSPGKAVFGLRVVHAQTGGSIGWVPALQRTLILGVATVPTFGLGAATLAWTAVTDPGGKRRGWHDRVAESVVVDVRPVPDAPVAEEEPPRQVVNLTAMRLVPPTAPPETPAIRSRSIPPVGRWRVSFDSGESFVVEGPAVVGRRPEPRPGEEVRHVVPLPSEDMSLSKTHAQIQVAPDGVLVVMDRGSTNGSVLIRAGVPKDLPAGRPTTLLPGDEVAFGDRRMTVDREA